MSSSKFMSGREGIEFIKNAFGIEGGGIKKIVIDAEIDGATIITVDRLAHKDKLAGVSVNKEKIVYEVTLRMVDE